MGCVYEPLQLTECVEEAGFTEKFCLNSISVLATVCLVGFIMGTIGMVVSLKLRRQELLILHRVVDSTTEFFVSPQSEDDDDDVPSTAADDDNWQPEEAYRRIAKLSAQRSGKYATMVSLVLEDVVMFVVNGACTRPPAGAQISPSLL